MTWQLAHQKPAVLNPVHTQPVNGPHNPVPAIESVLLDPLFEPVSSTRPVAVIDDAGNPIDRDQVSQRLLEALHGSVVLGANDDIKDLLSDGLVHYAKSTTLVNQVFVDQAAQSQRPPLPPPSAMMVYSAATDVVPAAKMLLGGHSPNDSELLAALGYTYAPQTLGFWFRDEAAFDDFTTWLRQEIASMASVLPQETMNLLNKFAAMKLDTLVEGLLLRKDDQSGNEEFSFPRVVIALLMSYQKKQSPGSPLVTGVLPFHVGELFVPRTVVLVNAEAHARASARKVDNEWQLINQSIASPVKIISHSALCKLTALPRAAAKAAQAAAASNGKKNSQINRSAAVAFRAKPPTMANIIDGTARALRRMKKVNMSLNPIRTTSTSFARANRRDPDDYNKPGKSTRINYLPDIHIYLDTSGSISEDNYQDMVITLIKMAKKLDVNIYFNSFSHVLSAQTKLLTKGKSVKTIWRKFTRTPKVTGFTDYEQIWNYINARPERVKRLSLIITDFEWSAPSHYVKHPPNLYYAPCSNMDWDQITQSAQNFNRSMAHIEPRLAQRMIGLLV